MVILTVQKLIQFLFPMVNWLFNPEVKFPMKKRVHQGAVIELPDGEWNRAEIICRGNKMTVYINGSLENVATLSHKTGYIALQSEGGTLAFRNVYLE